MKRVLVTWGSKRGGTEWLGQIIAARLERRGVSVVAEPVEAVTELHGFDAVVLGGALYGNRWTASARRFARRHFRSLRERPVWLFSSGPLDDSATRESIPPADEVATLAERLGALGHETFGGRLEENAEGLLATAMAKRHAGDWRDPEHARRWADTIANALPDAEPGEPIEPPARSMARLLMHGFVGAVACGALIGGGPPLLGESTTVVHAILAPLIFVGISLSYFRAHGAREPLTAAFAFAGVLAAAEVAVIDARMQSAQLLESSAFWVPVALVFLLTWATGTLMATRPWGSAASDRAQPEPRLSGDGPASSLTRS